MKIIIIALVVFIVSLIFLKIKITFEIENEKFNIHLSLRVLTKKINGTYVLCGNNSNNPYTVEKHKRKFRKKKWKNNYIKTLCDIASVIELEKLNIRVVAGTPFVASTVLSNVILNAIIPATFLLPFKHKKDINYIVLPNYNEFILRAKIDGEIKVSIFDAFLILLKYFEYS